MFDQLEQINERPKPFEHYTVSDLWTDEHTSAQMLAYHLDGEVDLSSRNAAFIGRSVDWIAARFNLGPETKVIDFGCGPGLYTAGFARHGADVTGVDFSKRSIQHAEQAAAHEGLSIHYVNEDYLEFTTTERFHLVTMIMCDFCVLSPAQRRHMLAKFREVLLPGGALLFDAYSLKAFEQRQEAALYEANQLNGFWSPNKYYGFVNTFKYEEEKVVLDKYTLVEADRTRVVYNWLQYFSVEALAREFSANGFAVEETYSDVAGTPFDAESAEFAVVAVKV